MTKYVFMTGDDEYEKYIINGAITDKDVVSRKQLKTTILKKIFRFHNAWPFNKLIEMPFKSIWYSALLDEKELLMESKIYFIFYESFHFTYSKCYLKYLKKKYQNAKFCFVFLNPANKYNLEKLNKVKQFYDFKITFFVEDAQKYGFIKPKYLPYLLPVDSIQVGEKSDVFFIGSDKGRLPKLVKIYEALKKRGLCCLFYIVGVDEKKQQYKDDIRYNQKLSYEEVLTKVKGTKCIIEVLQDENMYSSIRALEAFQFKKKLLTTNKAIVNEPYYTPSIIQVLDDVKSINIDFILEDVEYEAFPDPHYWSFASFKECLEK